MNQNIDVSPLDSPTAELIAEINFEDTKNQANKPEGNQVDFSEFLDLDLLGINTEEGGQNFIKSRDVSFAAEEVEEAFELEEAQKTLISTLLAEKRKIIEYMTNPHVVKKSKKEDKQVVVIDDDGGFEISDDEVQVTITDTADQNDLDKYSISTHETLENVNFMIYESAAVTFDQVVFQLPKVKKYCKKLSDLLGKFYKQLKKHQQKIDLQFFTFLYHFLVINHIEQAEIEIFFCFCSKLFDLSTQSMLMTQSVFSKLFQEIILRLEYSKFNIYSYDTLQACVLFLNSYLGILKVDLYDNISFVEAKRVIGLDAVLHLHLNSRNGSLIHTKSLSFLNKISSCLVEDPTYVPNFIQKDFLEPLVDILEEDLDELPSDVSRIDHIQLVVTYIQTAFGSVLQKLRRLDLINQRHNEFSNLTGGTGGQGAADLFSPNKPSNDIQGQFMKQVTLKVNNQTFKKPPDRFTLTMTLNETVRDLKHKVIEQLSCFGEDHISLMCSGKHLYNNQKTLFEFKVKDEAEVIIMENEIGGEFDVCSDMMMRHNQKVEEIKAILGESDDTLVSYILLSKGESLEQTIMALTCEEKDRYQSEMSELQALKSNTGKTFQVGQKNSNQADLMTPQVGNREKMFIEIVSKHDRLYDTIIKLAKIEHEGLKGYIWNLVNFLPPSKKLTSQIDLEFFSEPMYDFGQEGTIKEFIQEHTDKIMSYFYFTIINLQLYQCIKDRQTVSITEFFMNQNGQLITSILTTKYTKIISDLYYLIDNNVMVAQSGEQTLSIKRISTIFPVLNILQHFYNLAIGHTVEENKYLKFGNKLTYLELKNYLQVDQTFNPLLESYNWEMVSEIVATVVVDDQLDSFLDKLFEQLIYAVYDNTMNFNENPLINDVLSYVFVLLEKRAELKTKFGMGLEGDQNLLSGSSHFGFIDLVLNLLIQEGLYELSNNMLGNLLMVHLAWNKNFMPEFVRKVVAMVNEKGFFTKVPKTLLLIVSVVNDYLVKKDMHLVKITKHADLSNEILNKYLNVIKALPKISDVSEDNIDKVIPGNFEGIIDIMKSHLSIVCQFKENQIDFDKTKLDELYQSIVEPNIIQLFSETPTVFYRCISKGDNNLKNKFFEIVLQFCKIDSTYLFKILNYLTTVYEKGDFAQNDNHLVDIRKETYIGLKNLGCTCYANSMFQQFFHNAEVQKSLMLSTPNLTDDEQHVLYQVQKLFWRLKFTKMSHTFLDGFCKVFTGFDGLPIDVRVQQDVNEFFNLLVEQLEAQIKRSEKTQENEKAEGEMAEEGKTSQEEQNGSVNVFKKQYGGELINFIESIEEQFPYTRSRKEPFFGVSIPIKNIPSIYDALDEFCSYEYFKDDNKLHIDEYNTKIAVSKKVMFSKLPPTIIFNLKRFEYDMKTFQRYKLNDFFEFPDEIDLKPWLFLNETNSQDTTNYHLKGVLIHSGSASAGHYYSYIKLDGKWLEFNDTTVREFSPSLESKHKEWFGSGKTSSPENGFNMASYGTNSTSAYMLFYERNDIENGRMAEEALNILETEIGKQMMQEIETENKYFIRRKIFADSVSFRFLDGLFEVLNSPEHLGLVEDILLNEEKTEIKNQRLMDIMLARSSPILYKLANQHEFLKEFIPKDPVMDLGAGFNTPPDRSNKSIEGVFGMDDRDVAGDYQVNQGTGNDYGFDSFDSGIQKGGNRGILTQENKGVMGFNALDGLDPLDDLLKQGKYLW